MTPTNRKLPARRPTPRMIAAGRAYLAAQAEVERLAPIVRRIQSALLSKLSIQYDPEHHGPTGPITNPDHAYMMTDADAARYYPALDESYRNAGFNVAPGYCPLLMAHEIMARAERELLDAGAEWCGLPELAADRLFLIEYRQRAVDTHLRYLVQFLGA